MQIPSIPSDNIYKFFAIGAIIAMIGMFYLYDESLTDLNSRIIKVNEQIDIYQIESRGLQEKFRDLKESILNYAKVHGFSEKVAITDSSIVFPVLTKVSKSTEREINEIMRLRSEYGQQNVALGKKGVELHSARELLEYYQRRYKQIDTLVDALLVVIGSLIVLAFALWYLRVQRIQDLMMAGQLISGPLFGQVCQSCGFRIVVDRNYGGTELDGTHSKLYCSDCYSNGVFTEPDLTLVAMQQKIGRRLRELEFPKIRILWHLSRVSLLLRWRNMPRW